MFGGPDSSGPRIVGFAFRTRMILVQLARPRRRANRGGRQGVSETNDEKNYLDTSIPVADVYRVFAGLGGDIELPDGRVIDQRVQTEVALAFMKALQNAFSSWSMNEILGYSFIIKETIDNHRIAVKDIAHELGIPMSTASDVVAKLERLERVETFQCPTDRRRRLLRLHPKAIEKRLADPDGWAPKVRAEVTRILSQHK